MSTSIEETKKRRRTEEDIEESTPKKKVKRKQVKKACLNCRIAHSACETERPCKRCKALGLEASCIDVERRNAKRLKKAQENDAKLHPASIGLGNLAATLGLSHFFHPQQFVQNATTSQQNNGSGQQQRPSIPHHVFLSHDLLPAMSHLTSSQGLLIQQALQQHLVLTQPQVAPATPPQQPTFILPPQQVVAPTTQELPPSTMVHNNHHHDDFLQTSEDHAATNMFLNFEDENHQPDELAQVKEEFRKLVEEAKSEHTLTLSPLPDHSVPAWKKNPAMVSSGCVAFPAISNDSTEEMCIAVWTLDGSLFSANVPFLHTFQVPKCMVQSSFPDKTDLPQPVLRDFSTNRFVTLRNILHPKSSKESLAILEKVLSGQDLPFYAGEVDCCLFHDDEDDYIKRNSQASIPDIVKTYFTMYIVKDGRRQPQYAVSHISVIKHQRTTIV
jgi:hypothetical protein